MKLVCLLTLHHRYRPVAATTGFARERCTRCGRLRVRVLPALIDQVEKRLDLVPNPKYWTPGSGTSAVGSVTIGNRWLQRGYANEEQTPPATTGARSN